MRRLSCLRIILACCDLTPEICPTDSVAYRRAKDGHKSSFSEAQLIAAIREIEGCAKQNEVSRRVSVSTQTMARWRQKYSGMDVPGAEEKKRLEDENARLKKLVAQFALDVDSLKVPPGKSGDRLRATGGGQAVRVAWA